jgi:hypothetical protein
VGFGRPEIWQVDAANGQEWTDWRCSSHREIELTFCDSSGVHALYAIRAQAEASGHSVTLRRPQRVLRRVLEVTGTLSLFVIEE